MSDMEIGEIRYYTCPSCGKNYLEEKLKYSIHSRKSHKEGKSKKCIGCMYDDWNYGRI